MKTFWFKTLVYLGLFTLISIFAKLGEYNEWFNLPANAIALGWITVTLVFVAYIMYREFAYAMFSDNQTIFKGWRFSFFHIPIIEIMCGMWIKRIWYKLESSCFYDSSNDQHINKIYGVSLKLLPVITRRKVDCVAFTLFGYSFVWGHHWNSVRIGWRPSTNARNFFEIFSYRYVNGIRYLDNTTFAKADEIKQCEVRIDNNNLLVIMAFNSVDKVVCNTVLSKKVRFIYTLFPYFGGSKKAPKKMKIWISLL